MMPTDEHDSASAAERLTGKPLYDLEDPEPIIHAQDEDYVSRYNRQRTAATLQLLSGLEIAGKSVADVGCGAGIWTEFFVRHGACVTVVDMRETLLDATRLFLLRCGADLDRVRFVLSHAARLELPCKYDLVFMKDVVEHVQDEERLFRCLAGLVRPGGHLLLTTQNNLSLNCLVQRTYLKHVKGIRGWCGWDSTHLRFYNFFSLWRLLRSHGFRPIRYGGSYHMPRIVVEAMRRRLGLGRLPQTQAPTPEIERPVRISSTFKCSSAELPWCLPEKLGISCLPPFNLTGWAIGVLSVRVSASPGVVVANRRHREWARPPTGDRRLDDTVPDDWISPEYVPGLVSVIIPTYNREELMVDAIRSVLEQTYEHVEVIVVDDGSTDNTEAVVEALRGEPGGEKIRYFKQPNRGAPAARNRGLRESRGEFIQFLDSDDTLLPSKIEEQARVMQDDLKVDAVFSETLHQEDATPFRRRIVLGGPVPDPIERMLRRPWFQTSSPLWRRRVCVRAGPWREDMKLYQDWEYCIRCLWVSSRWRYVDRVLATVRDLGQTSIGSTMQGRTRAEASEVATEHVRAGLERVDNPPRRWKHALAKCCFGSARWALYYGFDDVGLRQLGRAERLAQREPLRIVIRCYRIAGQFLGWSSANLVGRIMRRLGLLVAGR